MGDASKIQKSATPIRHLDRSGSVLQISGLSLLFEEVTGVFEGSRPVCRGARFSNSTLWGDPSLRHASTGIVRASGSNPQTGDIKGFRSIEEIEVPRPDYPFNLTAGSTISRPSSG